MGSININGCSSFEELAFVLREEGHEGSDDEIVAAYFDEDSESDDFDSEEGFSLEL